MNRRLIIVALVLSFALSACIPGFSPVSAGESQATMIALAGTQAAYTLAALPTQTLPASDTPFPAFTRTAAPSATKTAAGQTATGTQSATATLTQTGSAASPTPSPTVTGTRSGTTTSTATGTATKTFTPTPGPLLYGTVPPAVPYGRVHLINLTNEMVYISFHCTLENGLTSYLEYPVYSRITVSIPAGPCHYIAWVKGKQFTGDIRIKKLVEYTFTFKKQKILVTQP